jgi:Na+-transporting NADH:ubiquinone oxidoreductase subunit B
MRAMTMIDSSSDERFTALALALPLGARLYGDGMEAAMQRLLVLALALAIAYGWAALFARRAGRPFGPGLPAFAMTFVIMLPGPVAWGGAVLALSFGAVFGREMFGGKPILPPALFGLAFAIFSFPEGGFEARGVLATSPDIVFALSCLPGAALLMSRGLLTWQVAAGAVVGMAAVGFLMGDPAWWKHPGAGAFAAGILFLAAAPQGAVAGNGARCLQGILVGALIVVIRLANPDQPDGVVFAVLLGGLFAPLMDRALGWRPRRV